MRIQFISATAILFSALVVATPVNITKRANAGPNPSDASFQAAVLNNHNWWRRFHHAPDLVWDDNLALWAQYAATTCNFQHTGGPYGENIYGESGDCDDWTACTQRAITAWANEESLYDYNNPGFNGDTGHFTQLVWKGSARVGCSWNTGTCDELRIFFCEYSPYGNSGGPDDYRANVQQP